MWIKYLTVLNYNYNYLLTVQSYGVVNRDINRREGEKRWDAMRCDRRRKMSAGEQVFSEELCLQELFEESFGHALIELWRSFHHWGTRFENSLACHACMDLLVQINRSITSYKSGQHKWLELHVDSYRKQVEQWGDVGLIWLVEDQMRRCILDHLKWLYHTNQHNC